MCIEYMDKVNKMTKEIKCRKTKDELYWRENCLAKILVNIPEEHFEKTYFYYIKSITYRTEPLTKVYDKLIEKLSKEFDIKIIIE